MAEKIVEVNHLTKKFGSRTDRITAVDDISFSIKEGEIVGLLGPNGAGKTTTINMILGLITPTDGTIKIFDMSFDRHREEILSQMNFSSSYTHLPWRLSVRENLYVVALLYSIKDAKRRVEEVIQIMNLGQYRNTQVGDLSAGWVTRLNLARTFINNPKFITLDEPTSSLDPEAAADIREKILKRGKENSLSILWTSHNMAEVEEVCDRVIFLNNGRIIAEDTPERLAKRIGFCRIRLMITDGQKRTLSWCQEQKITAVAEGRYVMLKIEEKNIASLLSKIAEIGVEYDEISIDKPTLEDFFLSTSKDYDKDS